jgi:hypothetical protein
MASQYDLNDPAQKQEYLKRAVETIIGQQEREIESHNIERS